MPRVSRLKCLQLYNLDRSRVVALVLDNVSYGEVAYDSLQSNEPRIAHERYTMTFI